MPLCCNCFQEMANEGACPFCGWDGIDQTEKYPRALRPGSILNGRYIVGRVLGQGGFGITYLAQDYQTKERVAIKEYFPTEFVARATDATTVLLDSNNRREDFEYGKTQFLEEARTLAAVTGSTNILRIYSYFEENGTAYFAMEYIEGRPLDEYIKKLGRCLTVEEAEKLFLPLMSALEGIHKKGIVHRDISPDNIIVTKDGMAKLIDFGAARYSTGEKSKSLDVILKHGFAPMEQYTRRGRQGPWTDVYALAATYYYAITGKVPPDAIDRIAEDTLASPVGLGAGMQAVLMKALAVQAPERWQNMGEFRGALQAAVMAGAEEHRRDEEAHMARETKEREAREKAECLEREKREKAEQAARKKAEREARKTEKQAEQQVVLAKKSRLPLLLTVMLILAAVIFGVTRFSGEKPETPAMIKVPVSDASSVSEADNPLAPFAGEYKEYSVILDGEHLILDDYEEYSVTLNADGTGYLDWGADNQGPISEWSKDGDKVTVKAGVSEMAGSLKNGVLILDLDDELSMCFVKDGADTSSMPRITLEEYQNQGQPSTPKEPEAVTPELPVQTKEYPVEGDYTFFAIEMQGAITGADELQVASTLRLAPDGTGFIEIDGEATDFSSWTLKGDTITITFPYDFSASAKVENGFVILDINGNGAMLHHYAHEEVEESAIEKYVDFLKTPPSSMLYSCWRGIDPKAGAHLSYEVDSGYMDAHKIYDVHTKDGVYYSAVTTQVSGLKSTMVTFFRDGTAFNLYPEDMTGILVTTTNSSIVTANVLRLDQLYLDMDTNAKRKDFTVETREIDGVAYTAEAFPADKYTAEAVYCFDENGQLIYYIKGAPVIETGLEIGESVYRLHAVDTVVNEELFDISGYAISRL